MLLYSKIHYLLYEKNKFLVLKTTLSIFIIVLMSVVFSGCTEHQSTDKKPPKAINGKFELSDWDFQKEGAILLNGQWEFYWNKLLYPEDFNQSTVSHKNHIVAVPTSWRNYQIEDKKLPNEGYATYRLLVDLDYIPQDLAINTKAFISTCRIWVDNKEIFQTGVVSDNPNTSKDRFKPQLITIHPQNKQFYITVQISNFGCAYGGFVTGLELGNIHLLNNENNKQAYVDMFLFGSILIMGLYHITLYLLRRKDCSTLYFGIICLLIAIRTLLMGQMLLYSFLPSVPLHIFLKLSMITLYLALTFFVMFIHIVFPLDTPRWFVRFSQAIGLFFFTTAIIFTEKLGNLFIVPYEIISVFILIVLLSVLIKAFLKKRESSILVLSAVLFIILIAINDILNSYGVISTGFFIPFGVFIFIFVQSFMLSRKFAKAFFHEEQLLKSELRMLQAQIKPHFLFNTLNTIICVCRESSEKAEELLLNLSNYLRCGFSFKNDDEFADLETELLHVKSYLHIEKARFLDKLNIIFDIDTNIHCKVPAYIIQPIVENSVRHGILPCKDGGTVRLTVKKNNNMLIIIVEDDGVGMTEEKLTALLNSSDKKAGIGISNIQNRIQRIYGKSIKIKSTKGIGTIVTLELPLSDALNL
ncbi:sensor histidine kinase [Clostridium cellulovorans]|uniref:histidine kinase n=1 Tax=Clostridium cellulovorans (strain ATCC 35296 / DSM 3052 / OCM 3 / 743B) TaxID=573061 RepID=D9ST97_CLOC7|nr:7TM diverse intracellular signaling domain-containing protein [Clostridium cellulovorans]ADL50713.1 signal transduction histidine kinase, LytS [Clostridium cellulovorans 743B]